MQPTVMIVLGNRPQFIKHAAIARAWQAHAPDVRQVVVDTGQHYDYELAGIFMEELALPAPDHSLGVGSASHSEQLARMLSPLEELMLRIRPAVVVVYGDTNSTLAGALAAAKLTIPVAHIEAGLRSFDRTMPEEINRVVTDHVSELLFCPTQTAVDNLLAEGLASGVHIVGDVMTDIALMLAPAADRRWRQWSERELAGGPLVAGEFGLVTVHRASNTEPEALRQLVEAFAASPLRLAFPVHPRTQAALERSGLHVDITELANVTLLPPLGYLDIAALTRHARCVLTDSGGLQKEAFVHGVPCITLRDTTEWVETIDHGRNVLVHNDPARIATALAGVMQAPHVDPDERDVPPVYGEGDAAERIVALIAERATAATTF